jgi:hypothetical protein
VRRREVEIVLSRIVVAPRYESNVRASRRTGGCSRSARSRHRSSERPAPKCLLISSAEPMAEAAPDPASALDRRRAAVLRFANEIEDGGMEWPATDTVGPEGWHYQLRATVAAAIEALIKARAGEAVQA